jgi:hypothetical protein
VQCNPVSANTAGLAATTSNICVFVCERARYGGCGN